MTILNVIQLMASVLPYLIVVSFCLTLYFSVHKHRLSIRISKKSSLDIVNKCNSQHEKLLLELAKIADNRSQSGKSYKYQVEVLLNFLTKLWDEEIYYVSNNLVPVEIGAIWLNDILNILTIQSNNPTHFRNVILKCKPGFFQKKRLRMYVIQCTELRNKLSKEV